MSVSATLLLLADSRFPTGAHAHSAGVEASHARGDIRGVDDLGAFLDGRLATSAPVDAAFAAAACRAGAPLDELDHELAVRTPSPRLRTVSRTLGRQLLRPAERAWPSTSYAALRAVHPEGPMQPVALGVGRRRGRSCAGRSSPLLAAPPRRRRHHCSGSDARARPVRGACSRCAIGAAARRYGSQGRRSRRDLSAPCELPAHTSVLADILAEHHATWEVRLFAS